MIVNAKDEDEDDDEEEEDDEDEDDEDDDEAVTSKSVLQVKVREQCVTPRGRWFRAHTQMKA
jgi:hypothetical protein